MTIDFSVDERYRSNVLPGNRHIYERPYGMVVGADVFRVAATAIVPSGPGPEREALEASIQAEHHRPGPYGLVFAESQLLATMHITAPADVQAFRAGQPLPPSGVVYGGWPNEGPLYQLLPKTTWFPDGAGVLEEYERADGAKVTVFEYTVDRGQMWSSREAPVGEKVSMVSWHCSRCHQPGRFDHGEQWENTGQSMRFWAAKHARSHASRLTRCEVPDGRLERTVQAVMTDVLKRDVRIPEPASGCAASGGCAQVRLARAKTAQYAAA